MNRADIILLIVLIFFTWRGWSKGFVATVISLLRWLIAWMVARIFYIPFTQFILKIWDPRSKMAQVQEGFLTSQLHQEMSDMTTVTSEWLDGLTLPPGLKDSVHHWVGEPITDYGTQVIEELAYNMASSIVYGIGFVVLFLGTLIMTYVIRHFSDALLSLPVLKQVNQTAGMLVGALYGVILVSFLIFVMAFFQHVGWVETAMEYVLNSAIAIYFYRYNLLFLTFKIVMDQALLGIGFIY